MRTRSSGASVTATVAPPCPRARATVAIDTARGDERDRRGAACARRASSRPRARCAPRNTLKNGTAAARTAAMADQPRPSPSAARDSATSAPRARARAGTSGLARASETSRFPRRRSVHQWACGFSANANEKSVATQRPAGRAHDAGGRQAEPRRRRAHGEEEGEREHGDVEARDRVVGVDAGPAQRGRAHEVRARGDSRAGTRRRPAPAADSRASARGRARRGRRCRRGRAGRAGTRRTAADAVPAGTGSRRAAATMARAGGDRPAQRRSRRPSAAAPRGQQAASARRTAAGKSQERPATSESQYAPAAEREAEGQDEGGVDGHAGQPLQRETRARRARSAGRPHSALWLLTC